MNRDKKQEKPGKRKDVVYLRIKGPVREWLEEERARRGGDETGAKLQPIVKEKLKQQMDTERRKK